MPRRAEREMESMELGKLTLETAQPLTGTAFEVTLPDGRTTTLKLDEVLAYERSARRTRGERAPARASFALYFLGLPELVLPQGCYTLRSAAATFDSVFLVPVGRDDEATEYEAIFT
jgi:hypothetical protein